MEAIAKTVPGFARQSHEVGLQRSHVNRNPVLIAGHQRNAEIAGVRRAAQALMVIQS
jgi:hypothetical protein